MDRRNPSDLNPPTSLTPSENSLSEDNLAVLDHHTVVDNGIRRFGIGGVVYIYAAGNNHG